MRRAKGAYGFVAAASSPLCFVFYACCTPLSTRVERGVKLSYKFVGILRMVELLWRFRFEGCFGVARFVNGSKCRVFRGALILEGREKNGRSREI